MTITTNKSTLIGMNALRWYLVSLGVFVLMIMSLSPSSVFGASADSKSTLPEVFVDKTNEPISATRTDPFFVFVPYGDPALEYGVSEVQVQVKSSTSALIIDDTELYDLYDTSNSKKLFDCGAAYQGPSQKITSGAVANDIFLYGPGSANQSSTASGTNSSNLEAKQVGCLKIGIKVSATAKQGDIVELITQIQSSNPKKTGFYKQNNTPPLKKIRFVIGEKPNCTQGQDIYNGVCTPACAADQYRDIDGVCRISKLACNQNQEVVGDICKQKCADNEARTAFGDCKRGEQAQNTQVELIAEYIAIFVITLIGLWILTSIIRQVRKPKKSR